MLSTVSKGTEYPPPPVPTRPSKRSLREAIQGCRACDLYEGSTQPVLGEGPPGAQVMIVGEQPGDREDVEGRPFVGPAGRVLDQGLEQAGFRREDLYLTNAVKHFRFRQRGKRRLHQTPGRWHVNACLPWLTTHPSAILRIDTQAERDEAMSAFVSDLRQVTEWLRAAR